MSSSEPALMASMRAALSVHLSFDWIEHAAIPIAISVMNTQPIMLVLFAVSALLTGHTDALPLDAYSTNLLLLGLLWWAMFVHRLTRNSLSKRRVHLLHAISLLVASAVILITHLSMLQNVPALLIEGVLLTWFWRRSIVQVHKGLNADYLMDALKQGFLVLLVVLCFVLIPTFPACSILLMDLTFALPIFCLSSLIALSFTRLNMVKKDYLQRNASVNPTRRWLLILFLLWGALVSASVLLEVFALPGVLTLLQPLLQPFVDLIVDPILAFLAWLFHPSLHVQQPKHLLIKPPLAHPEQATVVHLNLLFIVYIICLLITLVGIFLLIRFLHGRKKASQQLRDEIRIKLAPRAIRKARRQERKRQRPTSPALEVLDPGSARAQYRHFLQTLARQHDNLARHPAETPLEYQARLLPSLKSSSDAEDKVAPVSDVLDILTRAYRQERYGGSSITQHQHNYLQKELPRLIRQLISLQ